MLQIDNLETPLFGPISVTVAARECVSITGPSGVGKSVFLRAVVDLDPSKGRMRLNGQEHTAMPADMWRRRVAMVPSESGWWGDDVNDHFPPGADTAALLGAVGQPDALTWQVSRLSTGERQRLALVRALCKSPEVILLDEPTAALDQKATQRVETLIHARREAGAAIILVTHDPAQSQRLASRHFQMRGGTLQPSKGADA